MLLPIIIMTSIGFLAGVCLAIASKFFFVNKDIRIEQVEGFLSGANCGGCGYAGCSALAAAIVKGEAPINACPGTNLIAIEGIATVMGVGSETPANKVAVILCSGGNNAADRYEYYGLKDCYSMTMVMGGVKMCSYGCVGGGSCLEACAFDAIRMGKKGLPEISLSKCTGCGLCVKECPRHLITLKNIEERAVVLCSSKDKGIDTRKACSSGCIGCGMCVKVCSESAPELINNLAQINDSKCIECGKCLVECTNSTISFINKIGK